MYSAKTEQWKSLTPFLNKRSHYSVFLFIKSVYVVGGYNKNSISVNSCYKYDIKDNKQYQVVSLQKERSHSACTVFEGKIVVTGGCKKRNIDLRSVEAYDHHENKWTFLCSMITAKSNHSSISIGNKIFVIGLGNLARSEVYDNISRTFTVFKFNPLISPFSSFSFNSLKTFGISNKLLVFGNFDSLDDLQLYVFNVDLKKWVPEEELLKNNFVVPAYSSIEKHPKI